MCIARGRLLRLARHVWVRSGQLRANVITPAIKLCPEGRDPSRLTRRQVRLLTGIHAEIEQLGYY